MVLWNLSNLTNFSQEKLIRYISRRHILFRQTWVYDANVYPWENCKCNVIFLNNNIHGKKSFSFSDWPLHPQVHQDQLQLQGDLDHPHLQLAEDQLLHHLLLLLPVPVIPVSKCPLNANLPVVQFQPSTDPFPPIRDPNPHLTGPWVMNRIWANWTWTIRK